MLILQNKADSSQHFELWFKIMEWMDLKHYFYEFLHLNIKYWIWSILHCTDTWKTAVQLVSDERNNDEVGNAANITHQNQLLLRL